MAKLTTILIEKLWKAGVPQLHGDGEGLYFKVSGPKAASWVLRYQLNGKRPAMGLGGYPDVGLAEARDQAHEQRKLARVEKIDPLTHRQSERSAKRARLATQKTVKQLIDDYIAVKKDRWGHWMAYGFPLNMKNHVIPVIGDVLTRDTNTALVKQVLDPIWQEKPSIARVIQGDLSRLFEYALFFRDLYELHHNPARNIQKYMPKQREVVHHKDLPYEEMPAFIASLREYQCARPWFRNLDKREPVLKGIAAGKSVTRIATYLDISPGAVSWLANHPAPIDRRKLRALALEFLILTGPPRTSEILSTLWRDIDEDQQILIMPRPRMKYKKGDDYIIPLSRGALEIIGELKVVRSGDYLFPGSPQGRRETSSLSRRPREPDTVGLPMNRASLNSFLRDDLGRDDFDVHGLRKSFTNWAYAAGRFRDIAIELSLDHKYGTKIHRAYRNDQIVEERRELLQAWQNYCDGIAT